mmetsp:Transcript_12815/g.26006  ORF Transcript_12815/g.26006 Transcript_12815/m.26006 type:complete len:520 (-) Transcript_12815:1718-3277(-)|eukprot:CAMPEP_0184687788 /NCGR_PEP_ID=MMETSP0312-20130426/27550_1 /TAXON_ID=31354 /ORGANISM="Compsopogon coeruleus, Strain SAG 36.94" /LENGTH=519 /DNA_ID=CAMNT_0027144279 /DNA_START=737 /DNA_END=2296 /DNA_ORIENTATION=-
MMHPGFVTWYGDTGKYARSRGHRLCFCPRRNPGLYSSKRRRMRPTLLEAKASNSRGDKMRQPNLKDGFFNSLVRFLATSMSPSEFDEDIAKISIPALGALAMDPVLSLVDTAFVGRLGGAEPLAGVGISSVIFTLSFALFNFLGISLTPWVASALAKGDELEASRVIGNMLVVAVFIGTILLGTLMVGAPAIVRAMGASEAVVPHAVGYLRARSVASPFVLSCFALNGAYRGFQDTRTTLAVASLTNLVNLVLDPILIFHCKMGTAGAALATAISQILGALGLITRLIQTNRLRIQDLFKIPLIRDVAPIMRVGVTLLMRTTSAIATVVLASYSAARSGAVTTAAFEITRQCWTSCTMLLDSLSAASQSLIAFELGKGDKRRARMSAIRVLQIAFMSGAGLCFLLLVGNRLGFISVFSQDRQVIETTTISIPLVAAVQPINAITMALEGALIGSRDFKSVAQAMLVGACFASSVLVLIRSFNLGLRGIWIGLNTLTAVRAILLMQRFRSSHGPLHVPSR